MGIPNTHGLGELGTLLNLAIDVIILHRFASRSPASIHFAVKIRMVDVSAAACGAVDGPVAWAKVAATPEEESALDELVEKDFIRHAQLTEPEWR